MTQPSRFDPYTSQDLDAALNDLMMLLNRLIAKTHMNDQNPNQTIPVDITLKGPWKPTTPSEQTQVLTTSPHQTTLRFIGLHGQSLQVSLSPQVP